MRTLRFKTAVVIVALALGVSGLLLADEGATEREEYQTSVGQAVGELLMRLPEVWKMRLEARRLVPTLPDYEGEVTVPESEMIYSWLEDFCSTPHRRPGTAEGARAEEWVADKFREFGLEGVALEPVPITVWNADRWSLAVDGESVPSFYVLNTGFTGEEGVNAPLVYVGEGGPDDFERVDARGKIVVAEVPFPYLPTGLLLRGFGGAYLISNPDKSMTMRSGQYLNFVRTNFVGGSSEEGAPANDAYWNAYRHGAVAVCLILRDQPSKYNTHYGPYDGIMKPLPGMWIGKYDGMRLRELAKTGARATFTLTGTKEPGQMRNVWATLPGQSDEVILVTSHHDSPFEGASEDGAGTVQVLAQAWAWSKVPVERRPKTMVFVVDGGHFYGSEGAHAFAREHMDVMERVKILITLEHLAAKEVEEQDGEYVPTGDPALTVTFTSHDPVVVAGLMKAVSKKPPKRMASIPSTFFGGAPTSDASGYVLEAGVPVISWIGCPYYLLDSGDTLDKIEVGELGPVAETTAEIVKTFMAME